MAIDDREIRLYLAGVDAGRAGGPVDETYVLRHLYRLGVYEGRAERQPGSSRMAGQNAIRIDLVNLDNIKPRYGRSRSMNNRPEQQGPTRMGAA